jgi:hypothetical protein
MSVEGEMERCERSFVDLIGWKEEEEESKGSKVCHTPRVFCCDNFSRKTNCEILHSSLPLEVLSISVTNATTSTEFQSPQKRFSYECELTVSVHICTVKQRRTSNF